MKAKKQKFVDPSTYDHEAYNTMEHPTGESLTVPDDAMSIGEILERFTAGIDDSLRYPAVFELDEEPDIDDDAETPIDFTDITERQNTLETLKAPDEAADTTRRTAAEAGAEERGDGKANPRAEVEASEKGAK